MLLGLLAFLSGAALFLREDGVISYTLPRREAPPSGEHNLALHAFGPTIRASSYHRDPYLHHHPAFLVDAVPQPSVIEKWASAPRDAAPFTEILWREPRTLERVTITHAGAREHASFTVRRYHVSCIREGEETAPAPLTVTGNRAPRATHPLHCAAARGVRIDWEPNFATDAVRVYEVEAWGR